jgi:hypothetical protein
MVIGFATSCMNRRWQLEQTLGPNLAVLADTPHFIALCDYNSADAVGTLVEGFADEVRRGRLLYFRTDEPRSFHMSSGKNTAHRLALRRGPDVLFNLDADNLITSETIGLLERIFAADPDSCVHNWNQDWNAGTCGRVALSARRWAELGGYDEALLPVGWQDLDLMFRARAIGLRYVPLHAGVGPALANSYAQKVANIALPEAIERPTARDTYSGAVASNMITSLGRPIRLPMDEQRRFFGLIDFVTPATV